MRTCQNYLCGKKTKPFDFEVQKTEMGTVNPKIWIFKLAMRSF